jgi:heterogeneous nuclear ribonucleoprotein U-like protein 1
MNLIIDKENFTSAAPMHDHGFGYIWAGARATDGFQKGKVFFEVKLIENCDVSHLEDEPTPHVIRVGWSADHTSMQLGMLFHLFTVFIQMYHLASVSFPE